MRTNKIGIVLTLGCLLIMMIACGEKKKSNDIITERIEDPKPQEPVRLQPYTDDRDIQWIGRGYHIAIHRESSDSLPMVKDEIGQKFVDNVINLVVSRQDGSVFYNHQFTKKDFDRYIDDDYRKTGILEGLVFDKIDGDWLEFAASVSHPQTDEYIPLVVRLSRMGDIVMKRDSEMDTNASEGQEKEEKTEESDDDV